MAKRREKILIVDDDVSTVELLRVNLSGVGFEVVTALDGTEAIKKIKQDKPDMILLDIMLPDIDGFSVVEKVRASQDLDHTPIIIMSGLPINEIKARIPSYKEKSKGSRIMFFVKKPFELEDLVDEVRLFFSRRRESAKEDTCC